MTSKLLNREDIDKLSEEDIEDKLSYVSDALRILRNELGNKNALLGFCGSPWTLTCYMIQGGSADGFPKALDWARNHQSSFNQLLEKITNALIKYIKMQANCGVDALQIFDSWHNLCPPSHLWEYSLKWIAQLVDHAPAKLPLIVYANTSTSGVSHLARTGTNAIGLHHRADIATVRKEHPTPMILQGNLAPEIMETDAENVIKEGTKILDSMKNDPSHIMNLGHGVRPKAKLSAWMPS